jgi:hypothetical protein
MTKNGLTWVAGENTPKKTYITRVFNYGTMEEWKQLQKSESPEAIKDAVVNPLFGQWTPRARAFAQVIFDHQMPESALIKYHA